MKKYRFDCPMTNNTLSDTGIHDWEPKDLADASAHCDPEALARAADERRAKRNGIFWIMPLCHTLEAEGLGAHPVFSKEGARAGKLPWRSLDELPSEMTETIRCRAVWEAMEQLKRSDPEGRIVFSLTGPFGVLDALVPSVEIYRAARKRGSRMFDGLVPLLRNFACCARGHGADVFSWADPSAAISILGEKLFRTAYAPGCISLLRSVHEACPETVIHLCGRISCDLINTGFAEAAGEYTCKKNMTREELLLHCVESSPGSVIGMSCMNRLSDCCGSFHLLHFKEK